MFGIEKSNMYEMKDEVIKSLSREELEEVVRKLGNEVSELRDQVKFWRCRAEESDQKEGKVLTRSSISEEMLNELNNLAVKMDILSIIDKKSDNEDLINMELSYKELDKKILNDIKLNDENLNIKKFSNILKRKSLIEKALPGPPPVVVPPSLSKDLSKTETNSESKNIILKKSPPKMSKAEFMKRYKDKKIKDNMNQRLNSKMNNINKSRISLQWGCLNEEFPVFNERIEKNIFKDYFSEFEEKLSTLLDLNDINDINELKILSNSIFLVKNDKELKIPKDKLFEWFIKKKDDVNIKINSPGYVTNNVILNKINSSENNFDGVNLNKKKNDTKSTDILNEGRNSLFGSKTSRMLQITINYFKKKFPKTQQKNLTFFKKSVLECTLDKEGMNLLLETVPDPLENPYKFEAWKECVKIVNNYLDNNSKDSLLEEEEFVYFLSRIPNLSKRLECMILRSSFEQLYNESLKWINEKIQGLELILNHRKLPLLFNAIIESRNILNFRINEGNDEVDKVKFIPLSSIKKLQNLKSPNMKDKTLLNFMTSIIGEIFTSNELSTMRRSSEKSISIIYTMVTDLIFSWLELRDNTDNLLYTDIEIKINDNEILQDKFQSIMKEFYDDKYNQMINLCNKFKYLLKLYVASCYYFGDVTTFLPINMKINKNEKDIISTLMEFIDKYNSILKQENNKDIENNSPKNNEISLDIKSSGIKNKKSDNIDEIKNVINLSNSMNKKEISKNLNSIFNKSSKEYKTNIKELFAKSIVKELNLRPMFNKDVGKNINIKQNDFINENNIDNNDNISFDIEGTIKLSDSLINYKEICIEDDKKCESTNINDQINVPTLELSTEAKGILLRSVNNNNDLDSSVKYSENAEFSNIENYLDFHDDDNETLALSSPSYTRLLDISTMIDTMDQIHDSNMDVSNNLEHLKKKKVVIMADEHSPIKSNKFNRRQSIRRMCQIATYLDNNLDSDNGAENSEYSVSENNLLKSKYRSPIVSKSSSQEDEDIDYESEAKTCVLNDIFENHINKENDISHVPTHIPTHIHFDEINYTTEFTPQKNISNRRSRIFGGTVSPQN